MNEPFDLTIRSWNFRIHPCSEPAPSGVLIACHGWTGNEHSMEIFTQGKLRRPFWVIYPRAPYGTTENGFSWLQGSHGYRQNFQSFAETANDLQDRIGAILHDHHLEHLPIHRMGFSQGAALVLVHSILFSKPGEKIGLLSGFMPEGRLPQAGSLHQRKYFIAHGIADPVVPVEKARETVVFLESCSAEVDYCESDSGHKLNLNCFKQVERFFLPE